MELRHYLNLVKRWIPLAIAGAAVAGVLAYVVLSGQPRVYETSATLKLGQALSGAPILLTPVSDRLLTEYAYRGTSLATLEQVSASLGLDASPTELQERVNTQAEPSSTLLTITARASDPGGQDEAVALADAIGERLIAISIAAQSGSSVQQALVDDLDALRVEIENTRSQIDELSAKPNPTEADLASIADLEDLLVDRIAAHGEVLDRLISTGAHSLAFVSRAATPESPIEPRPLLYTALAIFTGLLLATALAAVLEYFDDSLRNPEDLEEASGLPTLGSLVELSGDAKRGGDNRLITVTNPRSAAAEEYRRLRANLEIVAGGDRLHTLLLTGSEPAIGIPVVAANLAVAFAESGHRVVLVDADFRHPAIHDLLRLPNEHGLSTLLQYEQTPPDRVSARTRIPRLEVITTGSVAANPARTLGPEKLKSVLAGLRARADIVLVSSPPLPTVSDALVLGAELHDTLLVVTRGKTRRGAVREAIDALSIGQARVLGAVLFSQQRGTSPKGRRLADAPDVPDPAHAGKSPERAGTT